MSDNKEIEYMRCFNCGKFIVTEDAYKGRYCTLACSAQFSKCYNCGSFFTIKEGYSKEFCSEECAAVNEAENQN